MNRRNFLQLTTLACFSATALSALAKGGMVGKLSLADFNMENEKGAAMVEAVKPTEGKFSKGDTELFMEVAMGGMAQLEISKVAVEMASMPDVKAYAKGEVEEQTGLGRKLQEIAAAKGVTLPMEPDARTKAMVAKLKKLSGAEFDKAYLKEGGVMGHEKLDAVMTKVKKEAEDPTLKNLEKAAHGLVLTHLKVAKEEIAMMS